MSLDDPKQPDMTRSPAGEVLFDKGMTMNDILTRHPQAESVLAGFHLTGCATCAISRDETLEEVCLIYGLPLPELLTALNALRPSPIQTSPHNT